MANKRPDLKKKAQYLPDHQRVLPGDPDAEKGILGSLLLSSEQVCALCDEKQFSRDHFHIPSHGTIFENATDLIRSGKPADFITLTAHLRKRGLLDQCGGAAFISDLFTLLPTAANAMHYMEIVIEKFTLRSIIKVATEYASRGYDNDSDAPELLDSFEREVCAISRVDADASNYQPINRIMLEVSEDLQDMIDRKGEIAGLSTGFPRMDHMTNGLQDGELIIIAARPSAGKTAYSMNMAEHLAIDMGLPVAFFSLEMSTRQLMRRSTLGRARVNWMMARNGTLGPEDYARIQKATSDFANSRLHICDKAGIPHTYIAAVLRRWVSKYGIRCAFIDYLQLLRSSRNFKGDNRQLEVADISAGLKALAKELNIPIVVLAQLNRNPENRSGSNKGRPRLSDIRESGSLEQDGDLIGLLMRDEMYADTEDERKEAQGKATLIIAKARNGPVGDIPLTFIKEISRFESRADEPH